MHTGLRRAMGAAALAAGLAAGIVTAVPGAGHAATAAWVPCGDTAALVAAIEAANDVGGGMIWLAPRCTYRLTAPAAVEHGPSGLPVIGGRVWISGFRSTITRPAGTPLFRIAEVAPFGDLTLSGVTVSGGVASAGPPGADLGGGILNHGHLTLISARVLGNTARQGGGIADEGGTAELDGTEVAGNNAVADGGGIHQHFGALSVLRGAVDRNVAGLDGGGIAVVGGTALLRHSSAIGNIAGGQGGGLRVDDGVVQLDDSRVTRNASASDCFPAEEIPGCA
ncbi:right-handed parallel beta-helix repeat-containing protein [Gandjariella thermophila]|uniref:Right handed beta helix domain-containing protein n=1 Tax=Gandjariella thermophila TaxID=1931992 RepID=A0A4D4J198_9PSEU|nr:right-handed parallel beta-helix repeat-containing protein [Gandjariella thermophila]GDY30405.1 hypothetical protein GTS_20380 [Gandjariella thermophila]